VPCPPGTIGGAAPIALAPPGTAEATWLKAGAAEVQPSGTDKAPSEAARPTFAVMTASPIPGEPMTPAPWAHPLPIADPNTGPDWIEYMSDTAESGAERLEVDIDADEVVSPETRLVAEVNAVDEDVMVANGDSGEADETEVAADASPCSALGIEAVVSGVDNAEPSGVDSAELSGDTTCMPVPAVVPATCVAAAASPVRPAELVFCNGAVNGVNAAATDDAPA
jgi:hypothetical protein